MFASFAFANCIDQSGTPALNMATSSIYGIPSSQRDSSSYLLLSPVLASPRKSRSQRVNAKACTPGSLEERIHSQYSFTTLDLSVCDLEKVPLKLISEYYAACPETLDLSFNKITHLGDSFLAAMSSLRVLNLSRNRLTKLPDRFGDLQSLEVLDLHDNQLQTLPVSIATMTQLNTLDISANKFRSPLSDVISFDPTADSSAMAKIVTEFLQEFSATRIDVQQCPSCRSVQSCNSLGASSVFKPTQATVSKQASYSHLEEKSEPLFESWSVGLFIVVIVLALLASYFVETEFMDDKFPNMWLWNWYRPMHKIASFITGALPKIEKWTLKRPPPEPVYAGISWNPFTHIRNYYVGFYSYVGYWMGLN